MWKDAGFTQLPNIILNNPAIPRCARSTYEAIAARAFGKRSRVFASEDTLAKDVGVSRRSISSHLKALETLHLIKRVRRGEGLTNIIVLVLKAGQCEGASTTEAIRAGSLALSGYVINRRKLTMKAVLALAPARKRRVGGDKTMREYEACQLVGCVCPACGVIRTDNIPVRHAESPDAWRRAGYLVILCSACRNRVIRVPIPARSSRTGPDEDRLFELIRQSEADTEAYIARYRLLG